MIPFSTFLLISSVLLNVIFVFKFIWTNNSKARNVFTNLTVMIFSTIYIMVAVEFYFSHFMIETDVFAFTLSSKKWLSEYWNPINSHGYRDVEHNIDELKSKKVIFVVGDSFVAGYGLKNYKDRFSNILQTTLGDSFEVLNIAKNGWNTNDEYNAIVSYPEIKPDLIISSYLINDIEGAAQRMGRKRPNVIVPPSPRIKSFIERSYFLNYFYWRLYRFRNSDIDQSYWNYVQNCYNTDEIWETHKQELESIINYTKTNNIGLIFLIFPDLTRIETSKIFTYKVVNFLHQHQVDYIDLPSILSGRNPQDIIVSALDPHPNEKLNNEIAQILSPRVIAIEKKHPQNTTSDSR